MTAQMTMPQSTLRADESSLIDCPPRMRFEAKKPTYMNTTMPTTRSEPSTPYCARLWIICGMPSLGPCAECKRHEDSARGGYRRRVRQRRTRSCRPNAAVASAPVTIVNGMRLEVNQMVKRSRGRPCLLSSGICSIVYCSISAACSASRDPAASVDVPLIAPPSRSKCPKRHCELHKKEWMPRPCYTYWLPHASKGPDDRQDVRTTGMLPGGDPFDPAPLDARPERPTATS